MKERIFFFFIIGALLIINVYTLLRFNNLKKQKDDETNAFRNTLKAHENHELEVYKSNIRTSIINSGWGLTDIAVKDSLDNMIPSKSLFKNGKKQILICRFSQRHCESCVDAMIQTLLQKIESIGSKNVVFLGNHRNNRIFKEILPLYNIKGRIVYNAPILNLPAENLGYPYLFILDSNLHTSNLLVHDKGLTQITTEYLENIKKRYFNTTKQE